MADDDNQLPGMDLAAPNELAFKRLYAKALLEQGLGPIPGPAVSPFQAIGGLLQGYAGRNMLNEAGQQERALRGTGVSGESDVTTGMPDQGTGPLSMRPPVGNTADNNTMSRYAAATSGQESGGNYAALGPVVKNPTTGQPDRAYGKYQVMGTNIPKWTQEILGSPMTPQQFLQSPQAQEAVYRAKFGQYVQQYGPEGAARAWFGGPKGMNNPDAMDINGMTVGRYGQNFTKLASNAPGLPQGAVAPGGTAAPIAPAIGSPQAPPAPAGGMLMTQAPQVGDQGTQVAARGPAMPSAIPAAPGLGAPGQVPGSPEGTMPSGFFAQRPHMTKEQYQKILLSPNITPEQKSFYTNLWLGQGQPTSFETPFGTIVRAPNGQQQFIGKSFDMTIKSPAGEVPVRAQYNPDGSYRILQPSGGAPSPTTPGPQGAPPPGPLGAAPPGTESVSPSSATAAPQVPGIAPTAAPGPSGAVPAAMPKFASLETGTLNDAGPLSVKPPVAGPAVAAQAVPVPKPETAQPPGAGVQTAQSMVPQYARDTLSDLGTIAAQQDMKKSAATKAGEEATTFVNDIRTKGMVATDDAKKLNLLDTIVHSPDYYSGFGSTPVLLWKNFVSAVGGDPKTAANMQLADKFMNDLNLDTLKQRLGGLGQIRVFEGNMVQNAFLNRDNSVVANQALVTFAKAVNQRLLEANEMTNKLLAANNWIPNPAIQAQVFNFFKDRPIMDDATAKQWNDSITRDTEQRKKTGPMTTPPPGAGGGTTLPPGFKLKGQ